MGSPPVAERPPASRIADRFEVVRTLGAGAMAAVYEVVDQSSGERLALKQLSASAQQAMPRARALFQREFHALSQLVHPCIVAVRDYGLDAQGPYFTMELLDGEDLRALAPMPWPRVCQVVRDVASCLSMLHSRGLLHRDVHYRNVRCTSDGRARLLDFGTLGTFGAAADVAGMAPFVAPEALRGQPLDGRCDLYSLGCLAYWLLGGEHAFPAYLHDELEGLWARGAPRLSERVPDLPPGLEALIASMMALDPLARPSSAAEVIHRLSAIAELPENEPVEVGRAYLQSPRLVGRLTEGERVRSAVSRHLRAAPSVPPVFSGDGDIGATGRYRAVGSRETGAVRRRDRAADTPLLVFEGPAGCGCTRMLHELGLEARLSGATVLAISAGALRAQEYGVMNALLLQLRRLRPDLEASWPRDQLALLLDADEPQQGPLRRTTGVGLRDDRAERKQAVMREVLLTAAARSGLLLAIDDFEACDVASAATLTALLQEGAGKRLLVGIGLRAGAAPLAGSAVDWLRSHGRVLELRPLAESDVSALLRSLFGNAPHQKLLASWVTETSGGNPLACMELVRHLVDAHVIRYERGAWLLPARPAEHGLPSSLHGALNELCEGLTSAARSLAETFCMFDAPLALERCVELSDAGEGAVFGALDELIAKGVVVGNGVRYRIAHGELRRALLASMGQERGRALHLRVGQWLKARGKRPLEAAWHFMEGGAEVEGAAHLMRSARANAASVVGPALRGGSRGQGVQVLRRALQVCDRTPLSPADRTHFAASCLTVESFFEHGDLARAERVLATLQHDAGLTGYAERDPDLPARRWLKQGYKAACARHAALPEHERGLSPFEAIGLLQACALQLGRAFAAHSDAAGLQTLLRMVEPSAHVRHPLAPLVVRHVELLCEHVAGRLELARTGARAVLAELDAAEAAERAAGRAPTLTIGWRLELALLIGWIDATDSDESFARAEQVEQLRLGAGADDAIAMRMLRHLFRGEQDAADELAERFETALVQRPGGGFQNRAFIATYAAAALAAIGDAQGLQQTVAQLQALSARDPGLSPTLQAMRAALHRTRGELDEARQGYEAVLREHGVLSSVGVSLEVLPGLARTLCAQGCFEDVLALAQRLERDDEVPEPERVRLRRALLPQLALARARTGAAERAATELEVALAEAGDAPLQAHTLHAALAAVAVERGDVARMQQHLRLAGKRARGAGSTALVAGHEAFAEGLGRRRAALKL